MGNNAKPTKTDFIKSSQNLETNPLAKIMNAIATRNSGRKNLPKSPKFYQNENDRSNIIVDERYSDFSNTGSLSARLDTCEDVFECSYGDFEKDLEPGRQSDLLSSISFALFNETKFSSDEVNNKLGNDRFIIRPACQLNMAC